MLASTLISLAVAIGSVLAMPAAPPALGTPVASNECAKYTDGEGFNAICAPLFEVTSTLIFQANDINTNTDAILKIVSGAIPSDNVLGQLTKIATTGLISGTAYAAGSSINGVATAIENATPGCKCDLASCYSALTGAAQAASINSNAQAACAEGQFKAAPRAALPSMAPPPKG
ncbi:hypothetical protein FIBSPDRAFT_1042849 [Athelia psychrophila]|uniref:Cell wall protein n=1 Tax=Athelia psychrophila TaxID=1759441 RepID=A0A166M721_9AGAM|nr:hypothetical protein FIBSPDRAFT_1042849 [Fibularhizoctonia sp. CBS 109695]